MLYFGNKETLENAIKDDRVIALLQSLGFKPIEDAQRNLSTNARTVHVSRLDSQHYFEFVSGEKSMQECTDQLAADLQRVVGNQVRGVHVICRAHINASCLPVAMDVIFDTIANALKWLKCDTELELSTITMRQKKIAPQCK